MPKTKVIDLVGEEETSNYEVETLLLSRNINGSIEYYVKWKGYDITDSSWEPIQHLKSCKSLIQEFEEKKPSMPVDYQNFRHEEIKYFAKCLTDKRTTKRGIEYQVLWKNFPNQTWERKDALPENLVTRYEHAHNPKPATPPSQKKMRLSPSKKYTLEQIAAHYPTRVQIVGVKASVDSPAPSKVKLRIPGVMEDEYYPWIDVRTHLPQHLIDFLISKAHFKH